MEKDVVCGMTVEPSSDTPKSEYKGQTYYFCSKGCKAAFDKNPERYIAAQDPHAGHHH